jgi:hypothetical protein
MYQRYLKAFCCRPEDFLTTEYKAALLEKSHDDIADDDVSIPTLLQSTWTLPAIVFLAMSAFVQFKKMKRFRTGRHKKSDS